MRGRPNPERIRWGEQSPGGEDEGHLVVMPSRAPTGGEKTAYRAAQRFQRQLLNAGRQANRERAAAEMAEARATPQLPGRGERGPEAGRS